LFGMEDKNRREEVAFYIKSSLLVGGGLLGLWFGTAHLEKFDLEQTLRAKLIGSTEIKGLEYGAYVAKNSDQKFCEVAGSYQIQNTGEYPFVVDYVTIELFELPYIKDIDIEKRPITSFSLADRLKDDAEFEAISLGKIKLDVNEQFGKLNEMQRSFGFIVKIDSGGQSVKKPKNSYVVVANARAGFDRDNNGHVDEFEKNRSTKLTEELSMSPEIKFLEHDLRHTTGTIDICQPKSPKTASE